MASLVIVLLQIFSWFWQWNNFKNRLIFGKVKAYKKSCHFWSPCIFLFFSKDSEKKLKIIVFSVFLYSRDILTPFWFVWRFQVDYLRDRRMRSLYMCNHSSGQLHRDEIQTSISDSRLVSLSLLKLINNSSSAWVLLLCLINHLINCLINYLAPLIRSSDSLATFQSRLKSHLFALLLPISITSSHTPAPRILPLTIGDVQILRNISLTMTLTLYNGWII